jgi:ABC-type branched-subunit amino acid transport system substrate-binding protein
MNRNATKFCGVLSLALLLLGTLAACKRTVDVESPVPECRVGIVMPTTGELAPYGAEGVIAARMAFEEAKTTAKHSVPVLLKEQDSGTDPDQANAAAASLVSGSKAAHIIVGEINSDDTAAMVSQAQLGDAVILAPTASRISLTATSDRVFRIWPSDAYEASRMKEYMLSSGIKRVGVLFIQVQYGEEMARYFEGQFRAAGGEVFSAGYRKGITDFRPLLQRMRGFDNLYLITYVEDAALLLKQAYEMQQTGGHHFRFFGTSVLDSTRLIEKAGVAAEGITFAVVEPGTGGDATKRARFVEEYRKARVKAESDNALRSAAKDPTFASFYVYDAVSLSFAACDAVAEKEPPSGSGIIRFLRSMPTYGGVTGDIQFDQTGDLATGRTVAFKRVMNGKISALGKQ